MQLTYHTDYALRLLIYLTTRPDRIVTTREVAEFYGISLNHLVKVAKSLTQAGWVISTRGVGGGVRIAEHTPEVTLGAVVSHTENTHLVECFHSETNACPIHHCCQLKSVLHEAHRAFFEVLDRYTVRDLALTPGHLGMLAKRA